MNQYKNHIVALKMFANMHIANYIFFYIKVQINN